MRSRDQQREVLERIAAPCGAAGRLPRALVMLAHPDDEVIALGARLERYCESVLLCVTDGAPANGYDAQAHGFPSVDAYREARREEQAAALALTGMPADRARMLKLPDGAAIADQEAMEYLPELTRELTREIESFQPEAIVTHPYEGGHPDHDSCAFAVYAAVWLCSKQVLSGLELPVLPVIVEAPSYHAGRAGMTTGCFLPAPGSLGEIICELSEEEQARKRARLACFVSQQEVLASFSTTRERFRVAPRYDFLLPPHTGQLLYESFGWGLSGARFRELAAAAMAALHLEREPA